MTSTVITTDTALMRMTHHLKRHVYKRGGYVGDAPLDTTTLGRAKTHIRVMKPWSNAGVVNEMAVRMYNTDILTARADGTVGINLGGHDSSPTTRKAINLALSKFVKGYCNIRTGGLSSNKVPVYYANGKEYVYYAGMVIDGNTGEILSELHPFKKIALDREQTKALTQGVKDSGFKAVFPMLWSSGEVQSDFNMLRNHSLTYTITHAEEAEHWMGVVSRTSVRSMWVGGNRTLHKLPKEVVWNDLMKHCKQAMYMHVVTDTYAIQK